MWLLSTDRAELHYFARNFDADGGYAILSHTWDGNEQSLQQVRAIQERCRANETNPRDDPELSPKIRECCRLAERHGYHWVWIDSCCIDKTSSSELSEAINSMYKWYKSSEVCYAYLQDVPSDCVPDAPGSAFRKSRWHTRGWTLQELIAPDTVIFLSVDWRELGTRAELAVLLQKILGLPFKLMLGVTRPAQYSACIRMSWAAGRETTRVEDEAYCMMGLFGVSMPTNYGEGKRAFVRLQYEIMQHKECDMSLFAFGEVIERDEISRDGITFGKNPHVDLDNPWRYLLADSPRQFSNVFVYLPGLGSNAVQRYPPPLVSLSCHVLFRTSTKCLSRQDSTTISPFEPVELPHATVTSYGIQFRLPVATVDNITLAVILCQSGRRNFGLLLTRDVRAKDPQRPRYFVGHGYTRSSTGSATYLARMCDLGEDLYHLVFNGRGVRASWRTIYLVPTASDINSETATSPKLLINCSPLSRFQLPRWLVDRFIGLQFEVDERAHGDTLQVVSFIHRSKGRIFMCLGTCTEHHGPDKPPLWANVFVTTLVNPDTFVHDCSEDHLGSESWAMRSRLFGDDDRTVRLSFTQCRRRLPEVFLVIHLELSGNIFADSVLKGAGISFPPLEDPKRDSESPCPIPDTLFTSYRPHLHARLSQVDILTSNSGSLASTTTPDVNTPIASLWQLIDDLEKDLRPHPTPKPSITPSQSCTPAAPPLQSSPSGWAWKTALHTSVARALRLLPGKREIHTTPARPAASQEQPNSYRSTSPSM